MKVSELVVSIIENKIDDILRDKHVINFFSQNINTAIRLQYFLNKKLELVLRLADVATLKSLQELFESINKLEKDSIEQKEKIAYLEELLKSKTEEVRTTKRRKRIAAA